MRRAVLAIAVLLATSLAGCSGGGGLSSYMVLRSELPDGYAPVRDGAEGGSNLLALGMRHNPGMVNNTHLFEEDGIEPGAVYAALYIRPNENDTDLVYSLAMRFADADEARRYLDATQGCNFGEDFVVMNGAVIATLGSFPGVAEETVQAIGPQWQQRVGGTDPCIDE